MTSSSRLLEPQPLPRLAASSRPAPILGSASSEPRELLLGAGTRLACAALRLSAARSWAKRPTTRPAWQPRNECCPPAAHPPAKSSEAGLLLLFRSEKPDQSLRAVRHAPDILLCRSSNAERLTLPLVEEYKPCVLPPCRRSWIAWRLRHAMQHARQHGIRSSLAGPSAVRIWLEEQAFVSSCVIVLGDEQHIY